MKLLTQTTLVYVIITVAVFAFGSWMFYTFLTDLVVEEADELLTVKQELTIARLDRDPEIEEGLYDHHIYLYKGTTAERACDTVMYDEFMEEELPFHCLHFPYSKNGID